MLIRALVATRDRRSRLALRHSLDLPVLKMIELRMALVSGKQDRSLLYLLNQFRGHGATVPANKVYAILGLTDTTICDINLRVDYSMPTAQFYIGLAKGILISPLAGGFDLLSVQRAVSELSREMPSWSPDWSHGAASAQPLLASTSRYSSIGAFCASGGELLKGAPWPGAIDGSKLHLSGHVVDRIERLTTEAFTDIEPSLAPPSAASLRDGIAGDYDVKRRKQIDAHYKTPQRVLDRLSRTPPRHYPQPHHHAIHQPHQPPPTTPRRMKLHRTSKKPKTMNPNPLEKNNKLNNLLDFMKRFPYPPPGQPRGASAQRTSAPSWQTPSRASSQTSTPPRPGSSVCAPSFTGSSRRRLIRTGCAVFWRG